ncbi:glycosyltransferase [Caldimonas brevitalea]|uniref:Glycosyltransferase n=1 Tax=Caldimonas brevitalea TaxID=413882 RepID=A0A0G3BRC2_9BURK|nr:glycosyltransferase [Caldimonas brevitalea]AKJ30538.1 glycosyltransferase [Caldimonas brevitalea]
MASVQNPQRTHVLQIVGNAIVGGMETYVFRLIERLPPERFRVTVLCPWESQVSEQLRQLGVEVLVVPMPDDPPWASIQTTSAIIKSHAVDVLHAHLPNAHLLGALAGRLTQTPVLTTIHSRQLAICDVEAHRLAGTHLSVICQYTYFQALTLGVTAAQLHVIPNGVDTDIFKPAKVREGPLRCRLGIAAETPLVGFIGRLSWEKGPESFLRAALIAHHQRPDLHFVLVGDGPMQSQCRTFIENFGMGAYAHLAGLQVDMPAVYPELDLVVSTSHSEAMPLALMEAMACGLPIVATRVGGVPEMVQHGLTGALHNPGDFDGIGAQIARLLNQPDTLAAMGQRARQRAESQFSLADSVARTGELLARLAQSREDRRRIAAVPLDAPPTGRAVAASPAALGAAAGSAATGSGGRSTGSRSATKQARA